MGGYFGFGGFFMEYKVVKVFCFWGFSSFGVLTVVTLKWSVTGKFCFGVGIW